MDNKQATLELGTKPVGKLLMQYALPAIIAMTAASLYNMIDSIFIGQGVGAMAISGLAITFPFMNLTAAFGAAVGIGASTYLREARSERLQDGGAHSRKQRDAQHCHRYRGGSCQPSLSRPHPSLFRSEPSDASLCARIHDSHPCGKRVQPAVLRHKRRASRHRQAQTSHVHNHSHGGDECRSPRYSYGDAVSA